MFKIKAGRFRKRDSFIQLEHAGNLKTLFDFRNVYREDGYFFTNVEDFQTVLNACLTVRDSEMLTNANF